MIKNLKKHQNICNALFFMLTFIVYIKKLLNG